MAVCFFVAGLGKSSGSCWWANWLHDAMRRCLSTERLALYRIEQALHPLVTFVITPVFALANAGVPFRGSFQDTFRSQSLRV